MLSDFIMFICQCLACSLHFGLWSRIWWLLLRFVCAHVLTTDDLTRMH